TAGQRPPPPFHRTLCQFFHRALEGLQSLRDLVPQQLGSRSFDTLLDDFQMRASIVELIPEFLRVTCPHFLENSLQSALEMSPRLGHNGPGHLLQVALQVGLQSACRLVQLRDAAAQISDLRLQARRLRRSRCLHLLSLPTMSLVLLAQSVFQRSDEFLAPCLKTV